MSYSYKARKTFRCFEKQIGILQIGVTPNVIEFQEQLDSWTSSGLHDDVCDEIDETAATITDSINTSASGKWSQSIRSLLTSQLMAAEMELERIAGDYGKLDTFRRCLDKVKDDYAFPGEPASQWPGELVRCRDVMIAVVDHLTNRCTALRQFPGYLTAADELCYVDFQRSLERAFLVEMYPARRIEELPGIVAGLHECFRRLYGHCLDALWVYIRDYRFGAGRYDCACTVMVDKIMERQDLGGFLQAQVRQRQRVCEALTIRQVPFWNRLERARHDTMYSLPYGKGVMPRSSLGRYMELQEDD